MADPLFPDRGRDTTRIEAFVDAAFAFSLTLLVISIDEIPATYNEMIDALKGTPAFLASFVIVSMFWLAHRTWSKRYGLDTTFSSLASLMLVFVMMVYVYPLKQMMSATLSSLSGGWIPSSIQFTNSDEVRGFFTIYGVGFVAACCCISILYWHAWRQRDQLGLNALQSYTTRQTIYAWLIVAGSGVASIGFAQFASLKFLPLAGWVYASLPIVMTTFGRLSERRSPPHEETG